MFSKLFPPDRNRLPRRGWGRGGGNRDQDLFDLLTNKRFLLDFKWFIYFLYPILWGRRPQTPRYHSASELRNALKKGAFSQNVGPPEAMLHPDEILWKQMPFFKMSGHRRQCYTRTQCFYAHCIHISSILYAYCIKNAQRCYKKLESVKFDFWPFAWWFRFFSDHCLCFCHVVAFYIGPEVQKY